MTDQFPELPPEDQSPDLTPSEPLPELPELPSTSDRVPEKEAPERLSKLPEKTTLESLPELPEPPSLIKPIDVEQAPVDRKADFPELPVIAPEIAQESRAGADDSEHLQLPSVPQDSELLRPIFQDQQNSPTLPENEQVPTILKEILERVKAMQDKLDTLQVGFG